MKRVWHPWTDWECFKNGFYSSCTDLGMTKEYGQKQYYIFLSDLTLFEATLSRVIVEWKKSCEHFLTNKNSNRIAWLGQASACLAKGLPSEAKGGFKLLSNIQQRDADNLALKYLNIWKRSYEGKNRRVRRTMEKEGLSRRYTRRGS